MAAGTSNYWEDLRKQARQLENELDLKLVSFSKLCTGYSHSSARDGRRDRHRIIHMNSIKPKQTLWQYGKERISWDQYERILSKLPFILFCKVFTQN
uniref:Golgi SNAP receptor complex member 1 n=1 Tax=Capra hircus TaxID=9925 RepID=A0A8C2XWB0_CAPHI